MTEEKPSLPAHRRKSPQKTRWGCLTAPIILAVFLTYGAIHDEWYRRQPIEVHLRDIFTESGFQVPDDVSDIRGKIGLKDFQGDFPASLTFTVRPDQIGSFMQLPERGQWKMPENFKAWEDPAKWNGGSEESNIDEIESPAGTFMIKEHDGEYVRQYGVNKETRTIYFSRSSW